MSCLQQSTVMHARHGRLFCNCWDIVTRDAMLQVQLLVKLSETQAKGCRLHVATCTAPCRHKTGWYEPCSYVTCLSWSGYSCSVSKSNFGSDVQPAPEYISEYETDVLLVSTACACIVNTDNAGEKCIDCPVRSLAINRISHQLPSLSVARILERLDREISQIDGDVKSSKPLSVAPLRNLWQGFSWDQIMPNAAIDSPATSQNLSWCTKEHKC